MTVHANQLHRFAGNAQHYFSVKRKKKEERMVPALILNGALKVPKIATKQPKTPSIPIARG